MFPGVADARSVTLLWDPSPTETVIGYKVYKDGQFFLDAGNVITLKIDDLYNVTTEFYVTAYDDKGNESEPSNSVTMDEKSLPGKIQDFQFRIQP